MKQGVTQEEFLSQIELIKQKNISKPRKNSKKKGDRGERQIVESLNDRFGAGLFHRVPRSGAIVGGINFGKTKGMRQDAIEILSSDIICPPDFAFSVESKNYAHDAVKIHHFLHEKEYEAGEWWKQCKEDALKSKRWPMLVVRLDRSPVFTVLKWECFEKHEHLFNDYLIWKNHGEKLVIVDFEEVLSKLTSDFFGI